MNIDPDLLRPGWAGELAPDEYAYLRKRLEADPEVRFAWGFQRGRKTFPEALLRKLAMEGDPEGRTLNVAIVRAWREASPKAQAAKARATLSGVFDRKPATRL